MTNILMICLGNYQLSGIHVSFLAPPLTINPLPPHPRPHPAVTTTLTSSSITTKSSSDILTAIDKKPSFHTAAVLFSLSNKLSTTNQIDNTSNHQALEPSANVLVIDGGAALLSHVVIWLRSMRQTKNSLVTNTKDSTNVRMYSIQILPFIND